MRRCLFVLLALLLLQVSADPTNDQIQSLPGLIEPINFKQFSGYIQVNQTQFLHYWFVESENEPASDPLVLWMNGGPGCSSLYGLFREGGPFRVHPNQTVTLNEFRWNQVANIIFLEAPVGVGFSYATDKEQYLNEGDNRTAEANYMFLQGWFEQFPEFRSNPFYVMGESYGGHYVPQLAYTIWMENQAGQYPTINLKGIAVGNAWTDQYYDGPLSQVRYAFAHGMLSQQTMNEVVANCSGATRSKSGCDQSLEEWRREQSVGFNDVMIYEPCLLSEPPPNFSYPYRREIGCVNSTALTWYLNNPAVISAINVQLHGSWGVCTNLNYTQQAYSVMELYPILTANYEVLLYSGDCTTNVNFIGTQDWIAALGYPISDNWRPWHWNKQIAGWTIAYANATNRIRFLTVKGAGHMVPQYRPPEAYLMFTTYLKGDDFQ